MAVRAHLFKIDGRVLGGMQLGVLVQVLFCGVPARGVLFGVLFRVMARGHFCSIDGRVLLRAFFGGVLLEVLACKHCYLGPMLVHLCFCGYTWDLTNSHGNT